MTENQISPLDLVVVNLYPFEQTIAKSDITIAEAIEQIDIGGPAMLRAAAKNFAHLTVLCDPSDYSLYLEELGQNDGTDLPEDFDNSRQVKPLPIRVLMIVPLPTTSPIFQPRQNLSLYQGFLAKLYVMAKIPHQSATWYQTGAKPTGLAAAQQLQGKALSYNNLVDLEAARRIIAEFDAKEPAAAVLKHTNPCGAAIAPSLSEAYEKAFQADSISAFGGIVALNQAIDSCYRYCTN